MDTKPKDTIITITVSPVANGKRRVLISGAPEQEMPVVRVGTFAELHHLLDEVWVMLQKRKPQVVKVKAEKPAAKPTAKTAATKSEDADQDEVEEGTKQGDQLVEDTPDEAPDPVKKAFDDAGGNLLRDVPDEPEQLPLIEGDTNG